MKEGNYATTLVVQFWCQCPHPDIYVKGMVGKAAFISVMVMAVSREIVALKQIGYDITDTFSVDRLQQRNNVLCFYHRYCSV